MTNLLKILLAVSLLISCSQSKQAAKKWDQGIRKDRKVFIDRSIDLAKLNPTEFALFCSENFPPTITRDSSEYLKVKKQYDSLRAVSKLKLDSAQNEYLKLSILLNLAESDTTKAGLINQNKILKDKVFNLELQNSELRTSNNKPDLPPVVDKQIDKALVTALQSQLDSSNKSLGNMTALYEACQTNLENEKDRTNNAVVVKWYWILAMGIGIGVIGFMVAKFKIL